MASDKPSNVVWVIFSQQQLIDHILNNVPPVPPLSVAEMLEAACEPTKTLWVRRFHPILID